MYDVFVETQKEDKKGSCMYCGKSYDNIQKHLESKAHKKSFTIHTQKVSNKINDFILNELNKKETQRLKEIKQEEALRKFEIHKQYLNDFHRLNIKCMRHGCNTYQLRTTPRFRKLCIKCYIKYKDNTQNFKLECV